MTAWDDRLSGGDAKRILDELASVTKTAPEIEAATAVEKWNRVVRVVDYLTALWKAVDPLLITGAMIDPIAASMSNGLATVRQFEATGDESNLDAVNAYLDQVLDVVTRWPLSLNSSDVEDLREAASSYRRTAGQLLRSIETDAKDLEGSVGTARAELTALADDTKTAIQNERATVEQRLSEVTATVQAQAARLDKALSTQQLQFLEDEKQRQDQFNESVEKLRSDANDVAEDLTARSMELVRRLEEHEAKARRLVSKTGSEAVSGGFLGEANRQKRRADVMTAVGFGLIALTVGFGYVVVVVLREPVVSLEYLTGRLLVVVPLVGLAIYSFRVAGQHRRAESAARSMELDHAALDPYLELLPDEEKDKLKSAMADRAFFRAVAAPPEDDITKDLVGLLQEAIKTLGRK